MNMVFSRLLLLLLIFSSFLSAASAVSIPVAQDTTTSSKDTLKASAGKSSSLSVSPTQDALVAFDLSQLPANYNASNVTSARLRLYVSRLNKPGDLSVHLITQAWDEKTVGPAPTSDPAALATIAQDTFGTKRFVIVDVTSAVQQWLGNPASNFGLAIRAAGTSPTARVLLGAKEGPGIGYPVELEVEIGAGTGNSNQGSFNFIGGGNDNLINPNALYATIPGGLSNEIGENGSFSLAAGRRAVVNHTGSFVWADSTNADFSSTADNQFLIRAANGVSIASDAGGAKVVPIGTRYRDNSIIAWGRVTAAGGLDSNFNVASIVRISTGRYQVNLGASTSSGFSLIATVTPEVDPGVGDIVPTGAANARFAVTNQVAAGNFFEVFIYNGSFVPVDNDFSFLVTGR